MNAYEFYYERTNTTYKRISKQKAKKLFKEGRTIIITPHKMKIFTEFGGWGLMSKCDSENPELSFNRIINQFTYYNCNNELGKYPAFYVTENLA